ncbi:forkhead box protein G1-like isoform X1 [Haliotis rufescens]|uniref:forkhead box protein G1-like isoform X1 n=1 Tax=Haliotis rufescens TaxID=6454 RepID=UPI001EAFADEC|nr:forkhead box protein G1-like isoform X1 [Haliotis rufescens]
MENSYVWKTSKRGSDLSKHCSSPVQPHLSYMLLCELLKMDIYNHNDPDHLSVMDMMDDRNDLDSLFLNSDRQDCGLDPKLDTVSVLPDLDAMDTGVSATGAFGEFDWIQGLQSAALAQLHQLSETENTDPNLLVNPQTAIPVHLQPPAHTQTVRDAMLTENLNNVSVIVTSTPTTTLSLDSLGSQNTVFTTQSGFAVSNQNKNVLSPSESSPVLVGHLQNGIRPRSHITVNLPPAPGQSVSISTHAHTKKDTDNNKPTEKIFPKPVYSYSCLIALALKNSQNGSLPVSEIYNFMTENFPYFKTAPDGWKNSVRHNLSLNKCFEKVDNPKLSSNAKKGCLWALNPAKKDKMEEEIAKGSKKDPVALHSSMAYPERLEKIERGEAGLHMEPTTPAAAPAAPCAPSDLTANSHTPAKPDDLFASELRDLNVLDSNFTLDPSLSDLAMQHGLWDDDLANDLNIDMSPHVAMATVGSPVASSGSSSSSVFAGLPGATFHGTCVYTSSPVAGLRSPSPGTLTATLLSLTTPNRTLSVAQT